MKQNIVSAIAAGLLFSTSIYAQNGLIGWATYNDLDQNGTTGGSNGAIVKVSSKQELEKYAIAPEPYVIFIEGSIAGTGMVKVENNKSIIGVGNEATLDGIGLDIRDRKNIIVRNLTIKNAKPDAFTIMNTHHVWIDHCDLSKSKDGLLDFTHGSNYLTVSWTIFHDHNKVSIINSGSQDFEDLGKNKVTYHHNWFNNTEQRNPRIGYGLGHVFNNYYTNVAAYCVGYHTGAIVLVENNYFYHSGKPLNQMYTAVSTAANYADAMETGNVFDSTNGNTKGTGVAFRPELYYNYKFALDSAKDVPALVMRYAGPRSGIEYDLLPTPANGSIDVGTTPDKLLWTGLEKAALWEVYWGESATALSKVSSKVASFNPGKLKPNTTYFWKVRSLKGDSVIGGTLWQFKTAPAMATKPFPANGESHAKLRQVKTETSNAPLELTWTPAFRAVKYKVYFGKTASLTQADYNGVVTTPLFAPGLLHYGVKYYWRIDAVTEQGTVVKGDTWSFSTGVVYSKEGITEAENMLLGGRAFIETQDGAWFAASNKQVVAGEAGPGSMSSVWAGANANYTVSISYFDENDGNGWYGFFVNEKKIAEWFASDNNNAIVTHTIKNVQLHTGDELRIEFYTNKGELNRTDFMNVQLMK